MKFPNILYKYVWRNWDVVPNERIAEVIGAPEAIVTDIAEAMGLVGKEEFTPNIFLRNRYSIIKRNWDIIPDKQICHLLGITYQEFLERLEDDQLYNKLGPKPKCMYLKFDSCFVVPESDTRFIKNIVKEQSEKICCMEPRFKFISDLCKPFRNVYFVKPVQSEIDEIEVESSWGICLEGNVGLVAIEAAKKLQEFMWSIMELRVTYSRLRKGESLNTAQNYIRLILQEDNESVAELQESFSIKITDNSVVISATHDKGIMRGTYYLQDIFEKRGGPYLKKEILEKHPCFTPRIIFSYFTIFGDVLLNEVGDPYPDGYLYNISRTGFNAIWIPALFRNMVKSSVFPEFGEGSEIRLKNLNKLILRAEKYGLDVYLYVNEPRGLRSEFYEKYPEVKGHSPKSEAENVLQSEKDFYALCTSTIEVKKYIEESTYRIFKSAPGLKGIIAITASEHITNCYSRATKETINCPRCKERNPSEVVAEVLNLMNKGAKMANPGAEVIAWSWSWNIFIEPNPQRKLINMLDNDIMLMTDFERGSTISVCGVKSVIEEYCISRTGPSQRICDQRNIIKETGRRFAAKIQLSNSLECGSVPYIPVPGLMADKFDILKNTGIDGLMESWSFGCYPSINADVANRYTWEEYIDKNSILKELAMRFYGEDGSNEALEAWRCFDESFSQYPFHITFLYTSPIQFGAAYKFSFKLTDIITGVYRPGEDYHKWCIAFGPDNVVKRFNKMIEKWDEGLKHLRNAFKHMDNHNEEKLKKDITVAKAISNIMKATVNSIEYLMKREKLFSVNEVDNIKKISKELKEILKKEISLAEEFHILVSSDSRIGFESASHYFYRPMDIMENLVGCHQILDFEIDDYLKDKNI